jgi:transposase
MKPLLTRNQVQILLDSGHTQAEIAIMAGISERTVRRIAQEPKVRDIDDKAERSKRHIGRPSKTDPFRKFVLDTLKGEPDLLSVELLRRARELGFDGGKSAFFEMVASVRPRDIQYTMRFEGLPGEFSQHDFGEVNITFMDGTKKKIHFFASRLKYSRWVEVSIVPNQQAETLVRSLADHFASFVNGNPKVTTFGK